MPLEDAIRTLSDAHRIPIAVNRVALEEIGLTADTPVRIALTDVSLRSFLRLMLRDLSLTYLIQDDVLQITTSEMAEMNLITRMYRMPDHFVANDEKIVETMKASIEPNTWECLGGPSVANLVDQVLIVSTTSDVHQQVDDFLNTLSEMQTK